MDRIRRSGTLRLEEGGTTSLAWSSATDEAGEQSRIDEADSEDIELQDQREPRYPLRDGDIADVAPFTMRGALPSVEHSVRQQAEEYYSLGPEMQADLSFIRPVTIDADGQTQGPAACRSFFPKEFDDDKANDFEPVGELPSLPKLNFKPIILRERTLIVIAIFYLGLIAGLGLLYHYENSARIFHIHATASRFTIRILPSVIGSLSTLIFQSVVVNFARILPYIVMARPIHPEDNCATAQKTLLAHYFPLLDTFNAFSNRHFYLGAMIVVHIFLNPFITPAKSALIHKSVSDQDPDLWTISISGSSAIYLIFNYSLLFIMLLALLIYLWDRRTGLKWDPVSPADHIMLLQGSNILEDFSGLEYRSPSFFKMSLERNNKQFHSLKPERYRLGYWRHRPTNQYWHGIRKWPASHMSSLNREGLSASPELASETGHESLVCSPIHPTVIFSAERPQDRIPAGVSQGTSRLSRVQSTPNIKDRSRRCKIDQLPGL